MTRLEYALARGGLRLPDAGDLLVIGAPDADSAAAFAPERSTFVQPFRPDFDRLQRQGREVVPTIAEAGMGFAAVWVSAVRSRAATELAIGKAVGAAGSGGLVVVDGAKSDGIDTHYKAVRQRADIDGNVTKGHGRLFWFRAGSGFEDWAGRDVNWPKVGRFHTAPGVFSADGIDPASEALANALPLELSGRGADLGAGWGFLADAVLQRAGVTHLDLVEADHAALAATRINIGDARARFHWADARQWEPEAPLDWVVMNPPFHTGRAADPGLGQAFIAAAARALGRHGTLWLVANRHLPYETVLAERFRKRQDRPAPKGFKIIEAHQPRRSAGTS